MSGLATWNWGNVMASAPSPPTSNTSSSSSTPTPERSPPSVPNDAASTSRPHSYGVHVRQTLVAEEVPPRRSPRLLGQASPSARGPFGSAVGPRS